MPIKTDVLIVGAGPAGSVAARYAAQKGVNVTVIERRREIGTPVRCGEFMPSLEEISNMFPNAVDTEAFVRSESAKNLVLIKELIAK